MYKYTSIHFYFYASAYVSMVSLAPKVQTGRFNIKPAVAAFNYRALAPLFCSGVSIYANNAFVYRLFELHRL